MVLSRKFKEAIKTALAMVIAYWVALAMDWDKPMWAAFVVAQAGAKSEVLIERRREDGFLSRLTDNYVRVGVEGPDEWVGEVVPVRLEPGRGDGSSASNGTRLDELIGIPLR